MKVLDLIERVGSTLVNVAVVAALPLCVGAAFLQLH